MGVKSSPAYLVASRLGHYSLTIASQQRTYHEYASSERRAFPHEFITLQVVKVQVVGAERIRSVPLLFNLYANIH